MPAFTPTVPGEPTWLELVSPDPARSQEFYTELFGWTATDTGPETGHYVVLSKDGAPVAGLMSSQVVTTTPPGWILSLYTPDAAATAQAVRAHGGSVSFEGPIMELGSSVVLRDPLGTLVAAWQPGTHPGFGALGDPGTPSWGELYTRDFHATTDFLRDALGWDVHPVGDTDDFRYSTLGEGRDARAGVMDGSGFLPEGTGGRWVAYIETVSIDEQAERAARLGGTVVDAPVDTPYGRLAEIADPHGFRLKLIDHGGEENDGVTALSA